MTNEDLENCLRWAQDHVDRLNSRLASEELLGSDTESTSRELKRFEAAMRAFTEFLEVRQRRDSDDEISANSSVGSRIGSLEDLPPELRSQIKSAGMDELEEAVVEVVKSFDGIASVDEILVGLYRNYQRIEDREQLSRKLYRMTKKGLLKPEPKRRGIYRVD